VLTVAVVAIAQVQLLAVQAQDARVVEGDVGGVAGQMAKKWVSNSLRQALDPDAPLEREMSCLVRRFKVSSLAILRRLYHAGCLSREVLWTAYDRELKRLQALPKGSGDR